LIKGSFLGERSKYAVASVMVAIKAMPKIETLRTIRKLIQELVLKILGIIALKNFVP
jgi:hypothetical protein